MPVLSQAKESSTTKRVTTYNLSSKESSTAALAGWIRPHSIMERKNLNPYIQVWELKMDIQVVAVLYSRATHISHHISYKLWKRLRPRKATCPKIVVEVIKSMLRVKYFCSTDTIFVPN